MNTSTTLDPHTYHPPSRCAHSSFHASVDVNTVTLEVTINVVCKQCGQPLLMPRALALGETVKLQGMFS